MKSSTGAHYLALDHIRALAAFMVFAWHFLHYDTGYPVPFEYVPPLFPLAVLDEGHTGVALFMTLSGYLFAKLLDGKRIHYGMFLWNRTLRLLPLLAVVIVVVGVVSISRLAELRGYLWQIVQGAWRPTLPNGGWSITIEFHFYVMLPALLWLGARSRWLLPSIIVAAIALRFGLHADRGEVQSLAYWTLIGRVDQFVLGMILYRLRGLVAGRHALVLAVLAGFLAFYWIFDLNGGFLLSPSYPSPSRMWIVLPTIEGLAYAIGIAWYDNSFSPRPGGVSGFVARIGEYSYSIYLLHFFLVFHAASFVNEEIMDISEFHVACAWAFALFVLMVVPGYLSYRFIEAPFLRLRRPYVIEEPVVRT